MLINELIYLLMACMAVLSVSWIFLKYRMRHILSEEELILMQKSTYEDMLVLNNEFMTILNKRKRELENEMKGLLREYDEPDKTFH